jgi:GPI mannosyltransferase 3
MSHKLVILGLFIYRILNSILLSTFFDPDEYWQLYEPAFHLFTNGKLGYLTWEWREGVRSWIYPAFISYLWRLIPTKNKVLIVKIVTGIISALIDIFTLKLATKRNEKTSALKILPLIVFNWFNFCYVNRALSNQLEALMVLLSFYFFNTGLPFYLFLGASFLIRPTAIVPLIFLIISKPRKYLPSIAALGIFLAIQFFVDSHFYKRAIFSGLNFFKVNVLQGISLHYGVNNPLYYLACLPAIFTTETPNILVNLWNSQDRSPKGVLILTLIFYSLLSHKEIRFIMPLVPLFFSLAGQKFQISSRMSALYIGLNILMIGYFGFLHQRGAISLSNYLSDAKVDITGRILTLMPCHSTPHIGYIQNDRITIDFISCEPPLGLDRTEKSLYQDDSHKAYENYPISLVKFVKPNLHNHLIFYEEPYLISLIKEMGYQQRASFFNGIYNPHWWKKGRILLFSKVNEQEK